MTDDAGRKALADEFDGEAKAHRAMGDADEANKCEMAAAALRIPLPATASREAKATIYIASKIRHAHRWIAMRAAGAPIISTWIDEAGKGQSADLHDLWERCISEAKSCGVLIVYRETNDVLKGAWVEIGAALAAGVPVYAVGLDGFTIAHYRSIRHFSTIEEAFAAARALSSIRTLAPVQSATREDGLPIEARLQAVRATTIEECAKVADEIKSNAEHRLQGMYYEERHEITVRSDTATYIAKAIRALFSVPADERGEPKAIDWHEDFQARTRALSNSGAPQPRGEPAQTNATQPVGSPNLRATPTQPSDRGAVVEEAIAKLREFDRLGLVIESAVRTSDPPNWVRVSDLIKRVRVFISLVGPPSALPPPERKP